ncbi:uncharacterized protein LOC105220212 [Zeugodacus cucurbitae]|uniref:uncharacterized protein LOC105220212 n=1 Tax=Zeugodacus cucurbitae TaxID=28588 RepID=UPI00059696ED|nr:uncharacterized protein LOC105220212 [Zeugodacus cucurbitae]
MVFAPNDIKCVWKRSQLAEVDDALIILLMAVTQILTFPSTYGYYIKPKTEESKHLYNQRNVYQQKLGLSSERVELLKSEKDQADSMDIRNRIIGENSKYVVMNAKKGTRQSSLLENMILSKQLLKTSLKKLNEDDEKSNKDFKRSRRKIAVRMVSDMPTEQIDELIKLFNHQHGIDHSDSNKSNELEDNYDDSDYDSITSMPLRTPNVDYVYENLYEDDQDATISSKTNSEGEFKSLQDLIMQATQAQWN